MATLLTFHNPFHTAFYAGNVATAPSSVPGVYSLSINDHEYALEWPFEITTLPIRRQSIDDSPEPGEQSLSTNGVWAKAQDNWGQGAGQKFLDNRFAYQTVYVHQGETPSVRTRFWRSMGLDVWSAGDLKLLPTSQSIASITATKTKIVLCGNYLYYSDGLALKFQSGANTPLSTGGSWTTVTSANTHNIASLATDGYQVWFACGVDGVYVTVGGSGTSAAAATASPLATPSGGVASVGSVGTVNATNLPAGAMSYYITAVDASGNETDSQTLTPTATTHPIAVSWSAQSLASSYVLRRKPFGGASDLIIYQGSTPSFTDDGTAAGTVSAHKTTNATGSTAYPATFLLYAKGHLLGSTGRDLVEILANGSTTFIYQHASPSFVFSCGAECPTAILVGGASNGRTFIGSIQPSVATNGATLASPIWATSLPIGESVLSMAYAGGLMVLGTNLGLRTGTKPDANGVFDIQPIIADPGAVYAVATYGRFCYFTWTKYDPTATWATARSLRHGVGRADLSNFTSSGVPAYATDIMADVTNANASPVDNVALSANGDVYWAAQNPNGALLMTPTASPVYEPTGWMEVGWVRYGTVEDKILVEVDFQHDALLAGESVGYQVVLEDMVTVNTIGTNATVGSTTLADPLSGGLVVGNRFMPILTLTRSTATTDTPIMHSHITKAMVTVPRNNEIIVTLLFADKVQTIGAAQRDAPMDTHAERQYLKGLENVGSIVNVKIGSETFSAYIDQIKERYDDPSGSRKWFQGQVTVRLVTLLQ